MSNVFLQRWQIWLSRKQRHLNLGRFYLRQYRWRAHFFSADENVRTQAENAFSGKAALITNAWQRLQRLRMLAGGIDANQFRLAAQCRYPLRQRTAGADPTLRQISRCSLVAEQKSDTQRDNAGTQAHTQLP